MAPEAKQSGVPSAAADIFAFGALLWEAFSSRRPFIMRPDGAYVPHPDFPSFPDVAPFNYAVLALACMAPVPAERPPAFQVFEVLSALEAELAASSYVDWSGQTRVRRTTPLHLLLLPACA